MTSIWGPAVSGEVFSALALSAGGAVTEGAGAALVAIAACVGAVVAAAVGGELDSGGGEPPQARTATGIATKDKDKREKVRMPREEYHGTARRTG